jgi:phosphoglycolate phosphatase-like HAD superfamily hydrolase
MRLLLFDIDGTLIKSSNAGRQVLTQSLNIDPSYFRLGAYGSDSADRNDLLPIAWQRASDNMNLNFSGADTVVIGDTPADIECAKVNGAYSLAVASGIYSAETLGKYQPDIDLSDLSDTNFVVELMSG